MSAPTFDERIAAIQATLARIGSIQADLGTSPVASERVVRALAIAQHPGRPDALTSVERIERNLAQFAWREQRDGGVERSGRAEERDLAVRQHARRPDGRPLLYVLPGGVS